MKVVQMKLHVYATVSWHDANVLWIMNLLFLFCFFLSILKILDKLLQNPFPKSVTLFEKTSKSSHLNRPHFVKSPTTANSFFPLVHTSSASSWGKARLSWNRTWHHLAFGFDMRGWRRELPKTGPILGYEFGNTKTFPASQSQCETPQGGMMAGFDEAAVFTKEKFKTYQLSFQTRCCRICKFELLKYTKNQKLESRIKQTSWQQSYLQRKSFSKMKTLPKQTVCWLPCLFSEGVVNVNGCYKP